MVAATSSISNVCFPEHQRRHAHKNSYMGIANHTSVFILIICECLWVFLLWCVCHIEVYLSILSECFPTDPNYFSSSCSTTSTALCLHTWLCSPSCRSSKYVKGMPERPPHCSIANHPTCTQDVTSSYTRLQGLPTLDPICIVTFLQLKFLDRLNFSS